MNIRISKKVRLDLMCITNKKYMARLCYIIKRNFGVITHYDCDMGIGFGVSLNY